MSVEVESEVEAGFRRGRRKRVRKARMVECREWEHPLSLSFPYARGFLSLLWVEYGGLLDGG